MPLVLRFKPFNSFFSSKTSLSCDFCSGICFPIGIFVRSGKMWRFPLMAATRVATAVVVVHPYSDFCPWPSYVADPFHYGVHSRACLCLLLSYMRCCSSAFLIRLQFWSACLVATPCRFEGLGLHFAHCAQVPKSLPFGFLVGNLK